MKTFDELLDAALKQRRTEPETAIAEVLIGDATVKFKFTEMDSRVWADLQAANPVRIGAPIDLKYGYNVHAVCEAAAPLSGVRIDGDLEVELTEEQWAKVFAALSGPGRGEITDAIWGLNDFEPTERLAQAKKASSDESNQKPPSPEN